jgi:hypothetical protein
MRVSLPDELDPGQELALTKLRVVENSTFDEVYLAGASSPYRPGSFAPYLLARGLEISLREFAQKARPIWDRA